MTMMFCIDAAQLRQALVEIEKAEKNGFNYCLAVFKIASCGMTITDCRAEYSDMVERAHPTDPRFNWGRFQRVTKQYRFDGTKLVAQPSSGSQS